MAEPLDRAQLRVARQKILRFGSEQLTDIEILAVLIGPGFGGRNAFDVARDLLAQAGNLHNLLQSLVDKRSQIGGLGLARLARLQAALELGRRYLEGPRDRRPTMSEPQAAANCFRARLADLSYEVFGCLFLDTRHRLICFEILFRGTVDGAVVYPREVLKRALHHNAAAVILGHNHPSDDCEPSEADRNITVRLGKALALVDIRLLDHLVVGFSGHVSLAERGWI